MKDEQKKLDQISKWYSNQNWGFYTKIVNLTYQTIRQYFVPGRMLEVGPADGEMTKFLLNDTNDLTIVDAAKKYVEDLKKLSPKITGHVCMAEEFKSDRKFDTIILAHVLEHVVDPVKLLRNLKKLLNKNGVLIVVVPNAKSIHRQIGVKMGLISSIYELNEADRSVDHKRVYDTHLLISDTRAANLRVSQHGGILLKPLSNQQIEQQWDDNLINGFYQLGYDYPDLCSEIFVVAK